MNDKIYMSAPDVGVLEEEAVIRAIRSGWVAPLGPEVESFEKEVAKRVGVNYGVATNSGTAALHLGLLALNVKPGDVVLTSTMTFVATANAIVYTGAEPFFIDSDIVTGNISPVLLRESIKLLRNEKRNIGAIVPVDLLGKSIDYTEITAISNEFGIPLLCDAAESLGATHNGIPAGSWGDASVVSFNGNKIMTTSGGGMLLTNNEDIALKARYLSTQARMPVDHYEHEEIGFNYRLSNVLASIGRAQLIRLDEMISRRRALRNLYRDFFYGLPGIEIFGGSNDSEDNCWLTALLIDETQTGWKASELSSYLNAQAIESRPLWKPMHAQKLFENNRSMLNGASEELFEKSLTLPSGSKLNPNEISRIFKSLEDFISTKANNRD